MFAALSAEQFASLEDVANDPTPAAIARLVESYAAALGIHTSRVVLLLGALQLGSERMQAEAERATLELQRFAPIMDQIYPGGYLDNRPRSNPRAPIPERIRRQSGRDNRRQGRGRCWE